MRRKLGPGQQGAKLLANVTSPDYHVTMKEVGIADLKARLSEHIRYVRAGHEVTVLDRNNPVARIVPLEERTAIRINPPVGAMRFQDVPLPEPVDLDFDIASLLIEERDDAR